MFVIEIISDETSDRARCSIGSWFVPHDGSSKKISAIQRSSLYSKIILSVCLLPACLSVLGSLGGCSKKGCLFLRIVTVFQSTRARRYGWPV